MAETGDVNDGRYPSQIASAGYFVPRGSLRRMDDRPVTSSYFLFLSLVLL